MIIPNDLKHNNHTKKYSFNEFHIFMPRFQNENEIKNNQKKCNLQIMPIITEVDLNIENDNNKNMSIIARKKSLKTFPEETNKENKMIQSKDFVIDIENPSNQYDTNETTTLPDTQPATLEIIIPSDKHYCTICFMEYELKSMIVLKSCNHMFCRECIIQYIHNLINIKTYNIICPLEHCKIPITEDELKLLIIPEKYENFIKSRDIYKIENDPNIRICPKQNCGKIIHLIPETNSGICECGLELCFKCGEPKHPNKACEEVIAIILKTINLNKQVKLCPKCNSKSIKEEGCNNVRCTKCSFNYCWNCLSEWNGNHICRIIVPSQPQQQQRTQSNWFLILKWIILYPIMFILIWILLVAVGIIYALFMHIFLIIILPIIIIICIDKRLQKYPKFIRRLILIIEIPLMHLLLIAYFFACICFFNSISQLMNDIDQISNRIIMKYMPPVFSIRENERTLECSLGLIFSVMGYIYLIAFLHMD